MLKNYRKLYLSIRSKGIYQTLRSLYYGYSRVNHFIVFSKDIERPFYYSRKNNSLQLSNISIDDLRNIRNQKGNLPFEFYCDEIHGFNDPYVAFIDQEIVAIYWLVYPGEFSRFLHLREGQVELNYGFVIPRFRGRGIAESLMAFIIQSSKEKKAKKLLSVVSINNIPSYKQMIRVGFEPLEVIRHFGFHRPKATLKYIK